MRVRKKRSVKGGMLGALSFNVLTEVGDGIFDEGKARISVRSAIVACLIFSVVSLDSFSKANAYAKVIEEGNTTFPDFFACLSTTIP